MNEEKLQKNNYKKRMQKNVCIIFCKVIRYELTIVYFSYRTENLVIIICLRFNFKSYIYIYTEEKSQHFL